MSLPLQWVSSFFAAEAVAPAADFTFELTIGINGGGNRVGRGIAGGFGSWNASSWTHNGLTGSLGNFQQYTVSPTSKQYLANFGANSAIYPDRIEVQVGDNTQTWANPGGGGSTRLYSTITGDDVLVASVVGQIATVRFYYD